MTCKALTFVHVPASKILCKAGNGQTFSLADAVRPKKRRFLKFLGLSLGAGVTTGIMVYYMAKKNLKKQTEEGKTTTNTV